MAGRSSQFGPYVDNVNQKFTGQYRDTETLNDFFNARYYTAPLMRFLSADPASVAAVDPTDPQTWNAYAYVRNSPLVLVDPSGMDSCSQYSGSSASGQYTQCEAQQNMYRGSDLAYGWVDPFQVSQIPVTVLGYVPGQAPQPLTSGYRLREYPRQGVEAHTGLGHDGGIGVIVNSRLSGVVSVFPVIRHTCIAENEPY